VCRIDISYRLVSIDKRARILIADDQPDVLEALRLLLMQYEFAPELVTTPAAVLALIQERQDWDVLLMDLNYSRDTTSGEEGRELLARVRELNPELPVVVMTAWGNVELAVDAMRAGAQSFVQKPWDNGALVQILHREVAQGRGARQKSEVHAREHRDALLIQRALLPDALPSTTAFEIAGAWQPAQGFGGDCYDAVVFAQDRIGLTIADVAGKGLPAALIMSSLQAAIRAFALESAAPSSICASVNRLLCAQMIAGRFATCCYLRLDGARGTVTYANAGHNPPLLVHADGTIERLVTGGMVMGVFADATFAEGTSSIRPGDRLALYTDGITEARNPAGEEYGEVRLGDAMLRHRHQAAGAVHAAVMSEVTSFASAGFEDDATMLVVAVR
jgi:sigma-B regulation protein RsbU (phosphoserine phosphatase)